MKKNNKADKSANRSSSNLQSRFVKSSNKVLPIEIQSQIDSAISVINNINSKVVEESLTEEELSSFMLDIKASQQKMLKLNSMVSSLRKSVAKSLINQRRASPKSMKRSLNLPQGATCTINGVSYSIEEGGFLSVCDKTKEGLNETKEME